MHLGTRDAELRPHSVRVSAVRLEDDGEHIVAFVPEVAVDRVLTDLRSNGQVAIVAAYPPTHRTYQLKGVFDDVRRADPDERTFIEQFSATSADALCEIGFDRSTFSHWPVWPSMAVRIRITAVFSQTPGPGAGVAVV